MEYERGKMRGKCVYKKREEKGEIGGKKEKKLKWRKKVIWGRVKGDEKGK